MLRSGAQLLPRQSDCVGGPMLDDVSAAASSWLGNFAQVRKLCFGGGVTCVAAANRSQLEGASGSASALVAELTAVLPLVGALDCGRNFSVGAAAEPG